MTLLNQPVAVQKNTLLFILILALFMNPYFIPQACAEEFPQFYAEEYQGPPQTTSTVATTQQISTLSLTIPQSSKPTTLEPRNTYPLSPATLSIPTLSQAYAEELPDPPQKSPPAAPSPYGQTLGYNLGEVVRNSSQALQQAQIAEWQWGDDAKTITDAIRTTRDHANANQYFLNETKLMFASALDINGRLIKALAEFNEAIKIIWKNAEPMMVNFPYNLEELQKAEKLALSLFNKVEDLNVEIKRKRNELTRLFVFSTYEDSKARRTAEEADVAMQDGDARINAIGEALQLSQRAKEVVDSFPNTTDSIVVNRDFFNYIYNQVSGIHQQMIDEYNENGFHDAVGTPDDPITAQTVYGFANLARELSSQILQLKWEFPVNLTSEVEEARKAYEKVMDAWWEAIRRTT